MSLVILNANLDNVLEKALKDSNLVVGGGQTAAGNGFGQFDVTGKGVGATFQAIQQAAQAMGLTIVLRSERNMVEDLAGSAANTLSPYAFALDDTGAVVGTIGKTLLPSGTPDGMSYTFTLLANSATRAVTSSKGLQPNGAFPFQPGKIMCLGEMEVIATPAYNLANTRMHFAIGVGTINAGAVTDYMSAGFLSGSGAPAPTTGAYSYVNITPSGTGSDSGFQAIVQATNFTGLRIGVYVNGTTGQVGVTTKEKGDLGYTGKVLNTAQRLMTALALDDLNYGTGTGTWPANSQIACRLHMKAAELQLIYPAGAVDVWGTLR